MQVIEKVDLEHQYLFYYNFENRTSKLKYTIKFYLQYFNAIYSYTNLHSAKGGGGLGAQTILQVRLGIFRVRANFLSSRFLTIFVVTSVFCFIVAVIIRDVSCVRCPHSTWNPRSLQSILNCPLYFGEYIMSSQLTRSAISLWI